MLEAFFQEDFVPGYSMENDMRLILEYGLLLKLKGENDNGKLAIPFYGKFC
jgi:hypothetical protein